MAGKSRITELELLVRRIDEVQETYEDLQYELDRDIRDGLIDLLDCQVALLNLLIIEISSRYRIPKAELDKLMRGEKNEPMA